MKKLLKVSFRLILIVSFCVAWAVSSNAQTAIQDKQSPKTDLSKKELLRLRPQFIGVNLGFNRIKFRDFATSPLFYDGLTNYVGISRLKVDQGRESELAFTYSFGSLTTTFNENVAVSNFRRFELLYSQLYRFGAWSNDNFNTKLGWMLNGTLNFRTNSALQNNALGLETFPTLFLSFKLTRDISRTEEKEKRFLFFKYKLREKQRNLSFSLNIGILNSSLRNGYIYSGQSAIVNDPNLLDRYEFKVFSGFRVSTGLNYTRFLQNKNAIQVSYIWDAYYTGGDLDRFEMTNHILRFTLLFNTNNK